MRHDFSKVNKKKVLVVVLVCIAVILLILKLFNQKPQQGIGVIKPEVETYTVMRQAMMRQVPLFGQTVANAQVSLAPKYSGRIAKVNVELGDRVEEGAILLVQDTKDMDLSVNQNHAVVRQAEADVMESESTYQANYHKATSDYELKKQNYERYLSLYEQGGISKEALDSVYQQMVDSKSTLDILVNQAMSGEVPATVEAKRAALAKAESGTESLVKQRDDLILRAPRAGVISYRKAEVGEIAQAGQKVLELVDNSKIYIDCNLSEQDIAFVKLGATLTVQIESLGKSYAGKIIYISPTVVADSKTYTVRIELTDIDELVKAGMFARTQIEFVQRENALFVPKEAIVEKNGKASVFVVDAENKVQQRSVELGIRNDKEVEILSGIDESEIVAISNLSRLKNNMEVSVVDQGEKP